MIRIVNYNFVYDVHILHIYYISGVSNLGPICLFLERGKRYARFEKIINIIWHIFLLNFTGIGLSMLTGLITNVIDVI